jgi:hypothetical protein
MPASVGVRRSPVSRLLRGGVRRALIAYSSPTPLGTPTGRSWCNPDHRAGHEYADGDRQTPNDDQSAHRGSGEPEPARVLVSRAAGGDFPRAEAGAPGGMGLLRERRGYTVVQRY